MYIQLINNMPKSKEKSIIDIIIKEQYVETLIDAYNVSSVYKDDLIQEIYLILLQYDKQKLMDIYNKKQLKFFIAKIITNQFNSQTSVFFKLYKKYNKLKDENYIPTQQEGFDEPDE